MSRENWQLVAFTWLVSELRWMYVWVVYFTTPPTVGEHQLRRSVREIPYQALSVVLSAHCRCPFAVGHAATFIMREDHARRRWTLTGLDRDESRWAPQAVEAQGYECCGSSNLNTCRGIARYEIELSV